MGDMAELDELNMYFADNCYYDYDSQVLHYKAHNKFPRWSFNKKNKRFTSMKNINKFYVGAKHIAAAIADGCNDEWSHENIEKAIAHAKRQLEDEGVECAIVVKIVAIVKREARPVKVIKL